MGLVEGGQTFSWAEVDQIKGRIDDLGALADGFVGEAVPVSQLLAAAGPDPEARFVTAVSDDGIYRASIPLADMTTKGWLAYKLDGEPLPRERGGPFRVVVPQGRTLCWNVKSVVELKVTRTKEPDSVPAQPRH